MSLRDDIMRLAHEMECESNAAFDLWTWLPSHKAAKACHGDYASEHQPDPANVMKEAAMCMALFAGYSSRSAAESKEWFSCPCGECEGPTTCRECDMFDDRRCLHLKQDIENGEPHEKCPFKRKNEGFVGPTRV